MDSLRILSLGRNLIKKIENLDAVADTLEELWISYNQIQSLVGSISLCLLMCFIDTGTFDILPAHISLPQSGIEKLQNLKVLYCSNNKVASWAEIDRLASLPALEDLLLVGNPLYNDYKDNNALSEYRIEVGKLWLYPTSQCHQATHWSALQTWLQVIRRLPNLRKLDGIPVDVDEREQANASKS
jgi:dynein light chain 1